jgi:hypothetical protein
MQYLQYVVFLHLPIYLQGGEAGGPPPRFVEEKQKIKGTNL